MNKNNVQTKTIYLYNVITLGFFLILADALLVLSQIGKANTDVIINGINEFISLVICYILIGIITYNVKQNKIYIKTNANLIKVIGAVVGISDFIPNIIYVILDLPIQTNLNHYLFIVGYFIIAIGYIFEHAIKMKEEQDLTI